MYVGVESVLHRPHLGNAYRHVGNTCTKVYVNFG